jgi:hypothetical protein
MSGSELMPRVTTLPGLSKPLDWSNWIDYISSMADALGVWEYCDPDGTETVPHEGYEPSIPMIPSTDGTPAEVAAAQGLYNNLLANYNLLLPRYEKQQAKRIKVDRDMAKVKLRILETISEAYRMQVDHSDRSSPRTFLQKLKEVAGQSNGLVEMTVIARLDTLINKRKSVSIEKWLEDWAAIVIASGPLTNTHLTQSYLCKEFVKSTASINKLFYDQIMPKLLLDFDYARNVRMTDLITSFRILYPGNATEKGSRNLIAFASIRDRSTSRNRESSSTTYNPMCLCTSRHQWIDCPYFNEKKRSNKWKPKPHIIKLIQSGLNENNAKARIISSYTRNKIEPSFNWATSSKPSTSSTTSSDDEQEISREMTAFALYKPVRKAFSNTDAIPSGNSVIYDTGANNHVFHDINRFYDYHPVDKDEREIYFGNTSTAIAGIGKVDIMITTPTGMKQITLLNVAHIPGFHINLMSWKPLQKGGVHIDSRNSNLIKNDGSIFCHLFQENDLLIVERSPLDFPRCKEIWDKKPFSFVSRSMNPHVSNASMDTWHRRLGHIAPAVIQQAERNVDGIGLTSSTIVDRLGGALCTECNLSRTQQQISRAPQWKGEAPFDKLHLDIIFYEEGFNGHKYCLHLYDAYTHFHFAETFPTKEAKPYVDFIHQILCLVKNWGYKVRYLHLDPESSLRDDKNTLFKRLISSWGILVDRTPVRTKEPNGTIERSGGVIVTRVRALLKESGLPDALWPVLLYHAIYLLNRTPVQSLGWKTPYELVLKRKPSLASLRIIGSKAYVRKDFDGQKRAQKTADQSEIGFYVGSIASNIFRIWIPHKQRVVDVRDVIIDESIRFDPKLVRKEVPNPHQSIISLLDVDPLTPLYEYPPRTSTALQIAPIDSSRPTEQNDINNGQESVVVVTNLGKTNPTAPGLLSPEDTPEPDLLPLSENRPIDQLGNIRNTSTLMSIPTTSPQPDGNHNHEGIPPNEEDAEGQQNEVIPTMESSSQSNVGPSIQRPASKSRVYKKKLTDEQVLENLRNTGTRSRRRREIHQQQLDGIDDLTPLRHAFATAMMTKRHISELPAPPNHWGELKDHPEQKSFEAAAQAEMTTLWNRQTFQRVLHRDRPSNVKLLPLKWVFTYKTDSDGFITKYKARICVRGDLQEQSHEDLYAATGAITTFRILMAIVCAFNWVCIQMDAVNAFINAELDEEVFLKWPEGFEEFGTSLRLLRALYGLKRSPKLWFKEISTTLSKLGFTACGDEPCLFIHSTHSIYVFVYVDDFLIMGPRYNEDMVFNLKDQLMKIYQFKDMGNASQFLNIRILRDIKTSQLWLCQDAYFEKLVTRFHLENAKYVATPLSSSFPQEPYDGVATEEQCLAYQQRVGSLIYPSIVTRPDLAFAASRLSQHNRNPSPAHLREADRAIIYAYQTRYLAICYHNDGHNTQAPPANFKVASDASYGDVLPSRSSTQGYLISLFGGPIAWQSSRQKTVTTSTTEAELLSLSHAARETMAMMRLFHQMSFDIEELPSLACDNAQTVGIVNKENPQLTTKLRHIDIHQLWLRQEVSGKTIAVHWVPTGDMPADGLTKALSKEKHQEFVKMLGLVDISDIMDGTNLS